MAQREIRQRCEKVARTVRMPSPFNMRDFLVGLGADRGRRIHLLPFPMPAGAPRGVCVASETVDYVVVDSAVSGLQREHITLHEVSHLLLGHELHVVDLLDSLFAHLNMDVLAARRVHARTTYSSVAEYEAETLASLLGHRAGLYSGSRPPRMSTDPIIRRLDATFEHGA